MPNEKSEVLKSYRQGTVLKYRSFENGWLVATVYVNGERKTGYISTKDVETGHTDPLTLQGIGIKNKTNVYNSASPNSKVLKSYRQGQILKLRPFVRNWYKVTVKVNDDWKTGYISAKDVEIIDETKKKNFRGIGAKNPTKIYSLPSTNSKALKSYKQGQILKFRSFTKSWYEATVYVNGKKEIGYISAKDVEIIDETKKENFRGIGVKNPTKIYSLPSTNSKALKSYKQGQILKFRSFTRNWYEATVYVNGKRKTGYISAKDIEIINDKGQERYRGIGVKNPTKVYSLASRNSQTLKSYKQGQLLQYRSFTKNWYEATIYVNGKRNTGYIHSTDVEQIKNNQETLNGIAIKPRTNIYTNASRYSEIIKSYNYGHILKFRTFTSNWYESTVYVNGKKYTGYIAKDDVNPNVNAALTGYGLKNKTKVYSEPSQNSKVLKEYSKGHVLKYRSHNSNWFVATVYVNGQKKTGYISTKDVSPNPLTLHAYAWEKPTNVYSSKSKKSKVLKSYPQGSKLKLRYHNSSWYEATVYIKGKRHIGYVYINDVNNKPPNKQTSNVKKPIKEVVTPPVESNEPVYKVPILMYHNIGDDFESHENGLYVSAESFKEQMTYLKENGYTLINFEDLPNIENINKPIIVTFDDGYENNMIAYDILKELKDETFEPKATIFMISGNIGKTKVEKNRVKVFLNEEQIKEMSESGIISIQSHTMTHPHFNDAPRHPIDYEYQLLNSKLILEQITGKEVHTIAYPYGAINETVLEEAKKYYQYGVLTKSGIASSKDSPYELPRVRVYYETTIEQFAKSIGE